VKIALRIVAAACAALTIPSLASAEAVEEKNLVSGKQKLDPASGYIFVQAPYRTFGMFLRVPDEGTRAEHKKDWDEAFAKAQKKYPDQLRSWQSRAEVARQTNKKTPEKPIEPTPETFSIDPIELRDQTAFGPMFIFSKDEATGRFNYLNQVKPGTYIYYGPLLMQPGMAAGGLCYCMGTVQFEVKPGVITDLGNFLIAAPTPTKNWDVASVDSWRRAEEKAIKSGKPLEVPGFGVPALAYGVPDSLKALPTVRAEFHASGKLNNYYALSLTRMPPIPGVLDYRRDTVIDLRTGQDVPNPPITTQVKIKK
jgi:hypothetical protein